MVTFNELQNGIKAATEQAKKSCLRHQCGAALLLRGKVIAVGHNKHCNAPPRNRKQCLL